ncbi:hypothetical protein LEP3755_24860 [Leptolyngbya sp. NIES-3755]|nr:hypothetical protein LEP3755_24860 [Leptolyngbya sp. NIES-3755]
MFEFVVIVESSADARTATKLAERVLAEKGNQFEPELFQYLFCWSGLVPGSEHSCWKNINDIVEHFSSEFKFPKIRSHDRLKTDGKSARKVMLLINFLQRKLGRNIQAVILIRDLDGRSDRRDYIEQARSDYQNQQSNLEIIVGVADRMREAWVLNGFQPLDAKEKQMLKEIRHQLNFDPCERAHRLQSNSFEEPDRQRNPKVVIDSLTRGDYSREQQCWEETSLELLRARGQETGLTAYLEEIERRLIPVLLE